MLVAATSMALGGRAAGGAPAVEPSQPGWTVLASSARGVEVDTKTLHVNGVSFTAMRFRARTTSLRLHVGSTDPRGAARVVPPDAQTLISQAELSVGVLGAFNSGFKATDSDGGLAVDGRGYSPLKAGLATAAVDANGHLTIGVWGRDMPVRGADVIAYRQNLVLLVAGSRPTASAAADWGTWGHTITNSPNQARSSLGIDASGNVVYVATMQPAPPLTLARALAQVAVIGMELDINADWPTLGVNRSGAHARSHTFDVRLAGEVNTPQRYLTGSDRDFFVVLGEPESWSCSIGSGGLAGSVGPRPVRLAGSGCAS